VLIGRHRWLVGVLLWLAIGCYESSASAGDESTDDGGDADAPEGRPEDGFTELPDCCPETEDVGRDEADEGIADSDDTGDERSGEEVETDVSLCPEGMALVPTGAFVMGSDPEEAVVEDETPEHVVTLSDYCVDIDEVSNAEYQACIDAVVCAWRLPVGDGPALPIRGVQWPDAWAFCAWRGRRLPSEAEWEKAGRGGCEIVAPATCGPEDERLYPWGDDPPVSGMANLCFDYVDRWECDYRARPGLVGSWPDDTSPYGVRDLLGNVKEWVADWYDPVAYSACAEGCMDPTGPASGDYRMIRGSESSTLPAEAALTRRFGWWPDVGESSANAGIRCALTPGR
jgi:formylglycine-generating enzyme required for sulfatase activity